MNSMRVKDFKFTTPTVCICEPNRYDRLYDGSVDKIPEFILNMKVYHYSVNKVINNTYMEAM